jgi:hypothetical protein
LPDSPIFACHRALTAAFDSNAGKGLAFAWGVLLLNGFRLSSEMQPLSKSTLLSDKTPKASMLARLTIAATGRRFVLTIWPPPLVEQ